MNWNRLICVTLVAHSCVKASARGHGVVASCERCGAPAYFAPAKRLHSCPICGHLRAAGDERDMVDRMVNDAAKLLVNTGELSVEQLDLNSCGRHD